MHIQHIESTSVNLLELDSYLYPLSYPEEGTSKNLNLRIMEGALGQDIPSKTHKCKCAPLYLLEHETTSNTDIFPHKY